MPNNQKSTEQIQKDLKKDFMDTHKQRDNKFNELAQTGVQLNMEGTVNQQIQELRYILKTVGYWAREVVYYYIDKFKTQKLN